MTGLEPSREMAEGDLNDLSSLKELRELVEFLKASNVAEFDMERPELKVRLKFATALPLGGGGVDLAALARLIGAAGASATSAAPLEAMTGAAAAPVAEVLSAAVDEDAGLHIVRSPLVGTFYDASSPGASPFVRVGDSVSTGSVVCIVEAMKIMNEVECDGAGEVAKVYARPGQPVEYGQKLFGLKT